jgi:hypothetical protein
MEEFITLPKDSTLRFCYTDNKSELQCATVKTDSYGRTPILDEWMNDKTNTIAKVDNEGTDGLATDIFVPYRPAAPVLTYDDMTNINKNTGVIYGVNDSMQYRKEGSDEWIDILPGQNLILDLWQGLYFVRYKAIRNVRFASHIAVIRISLIDSPIVLREVTLPFVYGVTFMPASGTYYVHSRDDFAFSVLFADGREREVKTNRIVNNKEEILTSTPNDNGGYNYLISYIQEAVRVSIGNAISANDIIDGTSVWAYKGKIYITPAADGEARIYTTSGVTVEQIRLTNGATTSVPVARGAYIILLNNGRAHKVIVN